MLASKAVTVMLKAEPAVAEVGVETANRAAAPGATAISPLAPVIEDVTVSVAVTVLLPVVLRVTEKVPVPLVSVLLAGKTAELSEEVKWTVPAYPVAVLLLASRAVTVMLNAEPAVAELGAETTNRAAGPGATAISPLVPVMFDAAVSVAVTVRLPAVLKVTGKVPVPLFSVLLAGSTALLSEEVKWTVPV